MTDRMSKQKWVVEVEVPNGHQLYGPFDAAMDAYMWAEKNYHIAYSMRPLGNPIEAPTQ